VLGALFRWLIAQRYVLANPFAGIKVRATPVPQQWTLQEALQTANGG